VVVLRPPARARPTAARRLVARVRERQGVLVVLVDRATDWPEGPDLLLGTERAEWRGAGRGDGHLEGRRVEVRATGRRAAGRPVCRSLWLPTGTGAVAEAPPEEGVPPGAARAGPR